MTVHSDDEMIILDEVDDYPGESSEVQTELLTKSKRWNRRKLYEANDAHRRSEMKDE